MTPRTIASGIAVLAMLASAASLPAQIATPEESTVRAAATVLDEIMAIPAKAIPRTLLSDAEAIAVVPDLVKGGFVVGVRHGRGVVVVRDRENGGWQAPVFITITGGSVGWQVGLQATDLILVFKTPRSVDNLMRGKFTIGADAAAAAGPVGRQAAAATDGALRAEILSYSRSRGLFAGVSIDGSALAIDHQSNAAYYGKIDEAGRSEQMPASALRLLEQVSKYATERTPAGAEPAGVSPIPALEGPAMAVPPPAGNADATKRQLSDAAPELYMLLDDTWKQFLALPAEVYSPDRHPSREVLAIAVRQFEAVAASPQYQRLAERPEFQKTYTLLRRYDAQLAPQAGPSLALPPPPQPVR